MTSPAAFRDRTNRSDGCYEPAIEVGSSDDAQPQAVLSALWSAASDVMDEWPAAIGTQIFKSAPFGLGIIGFEVSGCTGASTPAGRSPQTRDIGHLLPQGDVLHYGAANT
ncbi:hypothetical protein ACFY3N_16960 [Streptomyces sp. NPDC000348]|uniref:hypothetical protein n=1 Tax=Streptomyces sp. NPDC000348 TaxID=3364538 RepID=UPI003689787C